MTSNRPYLLRALYEWINDNSMTPHILVDAGFEGVEARIMEVADAESCRAVAEKLGIDPVRAAHDKIEKNQIKYPAEIVKGKHSKYSEYD